LTHLGFSIANLALDRSMKPAAEDVDRRRPVWEALSDLFLDTELNEGYYRHVACRIVDSGYTPAEIDEILWKEVFPIIECNLRHPCGEWAGFPGERLQSAILNPAVERQSASQQPRTARMIREVWPEVYQYLPKEFQQFKVRSWWQFW
jgi:hypothetical protein